MTNHVHIIAMPVTEKGLQQVFEPLHMRYAQRINRAQGWKGHLWQGRFFSSSQDDAYLWAAIRYVERNPVPKWFGRQKTIHGPALLLRFSRSQQQLWLRANPPNLNSP